MASKREDGDRRVATNRKAFHEYHVLEKLEAGIELTGTEVKAIREGRINLKDGYVGFERGEAWLVGIHISPYSHAALENHEPERKRKLLLHRREIERFASRVSEKGLTVIPLRVYFKGSRIKAEVALVRGKQLFDKRETEKQREADRETNAAMKQRR